MFDEEMRQRGFVFLSDKPGVMPALHSHREVEINLNVSGEVEYLFGGTLHSLPAGQFAVFWAMIPHQIVRVANATRFYRFHLPLTRFLQWQLPSEFASLLLHGGMICEPESGRSGPDLALFEQWHLDMTSGAADINHVLLLELEARLRRLARSVAKGVVASPTDPSSALSAAPLTPLEADLSFDKIERMAVYMTEHYKEPLRVTEIAAEAGLHPKYAMELFRRQCGMTLGEYLLQQRLSQAQRLLATTDRKVTDIAFASGFGSVSQFYEMFTRSCGQSPKEFRISQKQ